MPGLAMARNMARMQGGDVALRNRPEGGLEVVPSLPRKVAVVCIFLR